MGKQVAEERQQIKRYSGNIIHPNLDSASLHHLHATQDFLKKQESKASQSVIVRRAVRLYGDYVTRLNEDGFLNELMHLERASKGVL